MERLHVQFPYKKNPQKNVDCCRLHQVCKYTHTRKIFKLDFLKNKASNEKKLLYIFDSFFHVESFPPQLNHQYKHTLYYWKQLPYISKLPILRTNQTFNWKNRERSNFHRPQTPPEACTSAIYNYH